MYIGFVDESGTHPNSPVTVVAGLMIHEEDVWHFQQRLDTFLDRRLRALGQDHTLFELHATELWRGKREWAAISGKHRHRILDGAYACLAGYRPVNPDLPLRLLGVALDRTSTAGGKLRAYELTAKKFDDFVKRMSNKSGTSQRGLLLHDQISGTADRQLQAWISQWRAATSSLGRLSNLVDVPFFSDSKATRALQAADLVAYALYRYYSGSSDRFARHLWTLFDTDQGKMHGLFHQCRDYKSCPCPACKNRSSTASIAVSRFENADATSDIRGSETDVGAPSSIAPPAPTSNDLEGKFHQAMVRVYERARDEANYNARYFIQMVSESGGLGAARRLLASSAPAQGFTSLWEAGRLDLSVEATVLRPEYLSLFSYQELRVARRRLGEYGFEPD